MHWLGLMSAFGIATPRDDAAALRWWQKATDGGDTSAMLSLGDAYRFGIEGQSHTLDDSMELYNKAVPDKMCCD